MNNHSTTIHYLKAQKRITIIALCFMALAMACKNKKNIPDVSNIKVNLTIERFDKDFQHIDTQQFAKSLDALNNKYSTFLNDYLYQILELTYQPDSVIVQGKYFLRDDMYAAIYADAQKKFITLDKQKSELELALKLTKHYFPKYPLPTKLYTFIGPVEGIGTAITSNHNFAVGLQGYMGKDYPIYQGYVSQVYPAYITRRFEEQYIATNCIKQVIDEIFTNDNRGKSLIEQAVDQGRRLYILDALLPYTADSVKTGYTQNQLSECYENEKLIWAFFVQKNLLFEKEASLIKPYISDGPKTQELSETAPGNIGLFIGWQIVKKWMQMHSETNLEKLMQTPAMTIFNEANYKP